MNLRNSKHKGQGLAEYALILVLVALAVIVVMGIFGQEIFQMFQNIVNQF